MFVNTIQPVVKPAVMPVVKPVVQPGLTTVERTEAVERTVAVRSTWFKEQPLFISTRG